MCLSSLPTAGDRGKVVTEVEAFLQKSPLFRCERLAASITKKQCAANRTREENQSKDICAVHSCKGCPGLGDEVAELKELSMAKVCSVEGCGLTAHARGMCWKHERSVLGINPATGKPLVAKINAAPLKVVKPPKEKAAKIYETAMASSCNECGVVPCECFEDTTEVGAVVDGVLIRFDTPPPAFPPPSVKDSAMAYEIDALFASKRSEWLDDLAGATTERSRAKMFLAMADALEGLGY